jgi:hypothetical protein
MRSVKMHVLCAGGVGLLCSIAATAGAQEGQPDEKPDLELPEVIIKGIDESRLGAGEMSVLREPEAKAIPLTAPPMGEPADVSLVDHAARTEFGTIHPPELPPPLTVRGFLHGGSYQSLHAGFDAKKQLETGGVFGRLGGTASDGHLEEGAWSRTTASAGIVVEPNARSGLRLQLTRRSREQDLPPDGTFTAGLNPVGRVQTFRHWAGDLRYRYEERNGFTAGVAVEGHTAGFEADQTRRNQRVRDGNASIALEMPLRGRFWSIAMSLGIGGRIEELKGGGERERQRIHGALTGRVLGRGGLGLEAGVVFHRFGEEDIVGPKVRLSFDRPPVYRAWVGVAPYFREPDVLGFFDATSYAGGALGQEPERALWNIEGGVELQPVGGLRLTGESDLRQSEGFAHTDRAEVGLYELATLDERWILETTAGVDYRSPYGVGAELTYTMTEIEGTRIPYVAKHRGRAGIVYRGPIELGTHAELIGRRPTSPGERTRALGEVWLLSASGAVEIASRWWLAVEARNLTDTYYREFAEYDAPGRHVEAGVRYTF